MHLVLLQNRTFGPFLCLALLTDGKRARWEQRTQAEFKESQTAGFATRLADRQLLEARRVSPWYIVRVPRQPAGQSAACRDPAGFAPLLCCIILRGSFLCLWDRLGSWGSRLCCYEHRQTNRQLGLEIPPSVRPSVHLSVYEYIRE
jgi:hypothetical protein